MAGVNLVKINKVYSGGFEAIKSIDLEIRDKEFIVFVGPSGCGKSTLLRMIAGLEEISSGTLLIDGERMNDVSPKDRGIAMVFQNYALYPHMTAFQNMAFGLKIRKIKKEEIQKRVMNAAVILDMVDLLEKRPGQMSGGQQQRVAIGRAIVRRPKVFLFDEPLSNLDAKLRSHMRMEIAKLHQEINNTMIYVTHDQVEAMTLGDRIAVLKDGNLEQFDTPLNLYNDPANKFVAGFMGTPPMNFLKGLLSKKEEQFYFKSGSGTNEILLPQNFHKALSPFLDKQLFLGIRAEHLSLEGKGLDFKITINGIELLGNEKLVHLISPDGSKMIARFSAEAAIESGQVLEVKLNPEKLYFFDAETEKRIL